MKPENPGPGAEVHLAWAPDAGAPAARPDRAATAVTALYEASALGLIRMAYVMLGDLPSAEDVVQEAFCGLYRRWDRLADTAGATYYVRTSVLNGCRSALRRRAVRRGFLQHGPLADPPPAVSAETMVLVGTDRPGSGLLASSRVAIPWSRTTSWTQIQLTADGHAIFANVNNPYKGGNIEHLAEFSARTGKLVRVFNVIRNMAVDVEQIHWMSPSGRVLLVTDALRGRHHSNAHFADVDAGMIMDGRYTPLPWSENTFTAAW